MATDLTPRPISPTQPVSSWSSRENPRDAVLARLISIDGKPLPAPNPDKAGDPLKARLIELRGPNEALVDIAGKPYLVRSRTPFPNTSTLNLKFLAPDEPDEPVNESDTPETGTDASLKAKNPGVAGSNTTTNFLANQTPVKGAQQTQETQKTSATKTGQFIEDLEVEKNDAHIQVSGTGRLLAKLVDQFPQNKPNPIQIAANSTHNINNPKALAQQLQQSVQQSGLFYEAHVKSWAQGRYPLPLLNQEPQAKLLTATLANGTYNSTTDDTEPREESTNTSSKSSSKSNTSAQQPGLNNNDRGMTKALVDLIKTQQFIKVEQTDINTATPQKSNLDAALENIPLQLRPLIQDQINLLEQGKIPLAGQLNNHNFELLIEPDEDAREQTRPGVLAQAWRVNMRLETENLGIVTVKLMLMGQNTHIRLSTEKGVETISASAGGLLSQSLEANGLTLTELHITQDASQAPQEPT